MNVQKSELKMAMSQDLGKQFEARELALVAEANKLEGAKGALLQAVDKLEGLKAFYKRECDEEKLEDALLEPLVKAITRCQGVVQSLSDVAHTQMLVKRGEAMEAKKSLDLIEKIYNDEREKLAAILKGIEDGSITTENIGRSVDGSTTLRVVDGRPTNDAASDLAARRAAAKAEKETVEKPVPAVEEPKAEEPAKAEAIEAPAEVEDPKPSPSATTKRQMIQRRKKT